MSSEYSGLSSLGNAQRKNHLLAKLVASQGYFVVDNVESSASYKNQCLYLGTFVTEEAAIAYQREAEFRL